MSARTPIIALALIATATGEARADGIGDPALVPAPPPLANTAEGDRPLLREIGDHHVHGDPPVALFGVAESALPAPPAEDVWARVRTADRLAVPDNPIVAEHVRALRSQSLWIGKLLHRGTPFVGHVVDALDARYLPLELALLPLIESGFRPHAVSAKRASGLWQLMPETAREIGVERSDWYDGRADVVVSTTAALDYLGYLNAGFHGDWELTLAAYNAGPGRVRRAIRRNRAAGLPEDFWSLPLPAETRAYVPKLLALVAFLRDDGGSGLDVPRVPLEPAFVRVDIGRRITLDRAAELGRVPERELRRLNAGLLHGVTPPDGPHALYVPRRTRAGLLSRLAAADASPPSATHEVVAGDTLSGIALAHGISEERLMALNGLADTLIRTGQTLALRDARDTDEASVEHVVASGDTLSGIARRYAVGIDAITDRDGHALEADLIRPGERLRVRLGGAG